ncbi:MAG: hypothetical protein JJU11_13450, partial [Candidatus Sumerlaeia bacterium]|nr:hypothetical protein [Candidatus Sumerlaeia bacterium]
MIQKRLLFALFALSVVPFLASAQPVVSNVNFAQQPDGFGSTQVVVNYDLVSDDGPSTVSLLYSLGSAPFELATAVGGDVGGGIDTGIGKEILWSVAEDIPSTESTNLIVRVLAEDGQPIELNISATVADGGLTNVPNQTMTFTFDEAVTGFTVDDVTVTNATKGVFDGSGAVYTLDIIADGDGSVTVLVPAGAANSAVSPGIQNTASGIHTFDFNGSAPALDTVTITSDNANPEFAAEGDTITLSITSSRDITEPTVTISGSAANVSGSGNTYTATHIVQASDTEGTVLFSIDGFDDLYGNPGPNISSTTDASSVTIDTTAPTLDTVTITSNNANTSLAREGEMITVSMTASEAISAPTVTIAGSAVTVFGSGSSYTASYTVQAGDSGPAGVIISGFADQAGNAGSTVSATTDASLVTIDTTAPTLNTVTIASNNANTSFAREGDVITVSMTAGEVISAPTVTIAGSAVTVFGSGSS